MNWLGQYERTLIWSLLFVAVFVAGSDQHLMLRTLLATCSASVVYVVLTWLAYQRLTEPELRRWANAPAPSFLQRHSWIDFWILGGRTGLAFVMVASFLGMIIAFMFLPLADNLDLPFVQEKVLIALCVLNVVCSWLMAHFAYALHYGYLYYRQGEVGLDFPGDEPLDIMDFVYFALTVGTTAASSDVNVTSKAVRRVVTGHTVFSFVFNTAILALTLQFATS